MNLLLTDYTAVGASKLVNAPDLPAHHRRVMTSDQTTFLGPTLLETSIGDLPPFVLKRRMNAPCSSLPKAPFGLSNPSWSLVLMSAKRMVSVSTVWGVRLTPRPSDKSLPSNTDGKMAVHHVCEFRLPMRRLFRATMR